MTNRAEMIQQMRDLPEQLEAKIAGFTDEQLTTHYNEGEWTIAQNVHHLADSHVICYRRFKLMLTNKEHFQFTSYTPDELANLPDGNSAATIPDSLLILQGLHSRWAVMMEGMTEDQWAITGIHSSGEISLQRLLEIYSQHGLVHLQQIQEVIDKIPSA